MHMLCGGAIIQVNEDGACECRRGLAVALLASSFTPIMQVNEGHASECLLRRPLKSLCIHLRLKLSKSKLRKNLC